MTAEIRIDLNGCARCQGDGHPGLTFRPLTHPVWEGDVVIATHHADCPTNGEPILLTFTPDPQPLAVSLPPSPTASYARPAGDYPRSPGAW